MLFLLLRAEFVAAVQVVVYAGAVMVLYVFVVAYVGGEGESLGERLRGRGPVGSRPAPRRRAARRGAAGRAADRAARHRAWQAIDHYGAGYAPGAAAFGTPAYIGNLLLTRFLLAFEVASFLLLIAAVGGGRARAPPRRPRGATSEPRRCDCCARSTCRAARQRPAGTMAEARRRTAASRGAP